MRHQPIRLLAQPNYEGAYDIDQDPLWTHTAQALPIDVLAWYQCDHLGTPQELTDHNGQLAWSAQYKAWGEIKEQRSEWAQREGLTNPIGFQGQYHDHETGLHYNRHRYYDPLVLVPADNVKGQISLILNAIERATEIMSKLKIR